MAERMIIVSADFKWVVITVQIYKGGATYTRNVSDGNPHTLSGTEGEQFYMTWKRGMNTAFASGDYLKYGQLFEISDNESPIVFSSVEVPCPEVPQPIHCFAAGTPVVMADDSRRRIEDVRPGHMLLSLVGPDDEESSVRVESVSRAYVQDTVLLFVSSGEVLRASPSQPIVTMAGPVLAAQLADNARVYASRKRRHNGQRDVATIIARLQEGESQEVFSLHLENQTHFFVGERSAIRSNCKGGGGPGGCFASGTQIILPNGSSKSIENIGKGEIVAGISRHAPQKEFMSCRVVHRSSCQVPFAIKLIISGGQTILCSDGQPILTTAGPVRAGDIFVGAELVAVTKGGLAIEQKALVSGPHTVHTLEVEGGIDFAIGTAAHPLVGSIKN